MSTGVRYSRLFLLPTISGDPRTPTDRIMRWERTGGVRESPEDYPKEMWACSHLHRTEEAASLCKRCDS